METWEVVGYDKNAVRTIKAENKSFRGICLYLVGDAPADSNGRFCGRVCRDQFLSNERLQKLNVSFTPGDIITIYFNRFGDVDKIDRIG